MPNETWGVEFWGPALTAAWSKIKDPTGKPIKVYGFNEIPSAIKTVPCAFSFIDSPLDADYSLGGMNQMHWKGLTEFHLTQDLSRTNLNAIWPYFRKIVEAAAASCTLSGKVEIFQLRSASSIVLDAVNFGAETEHWALLAYWEVFESAANKITVGV